MVLSPPTFACTSCLCLDIHMSNAFGCVVALLHTFHREDHSLAVFLLQDIVILNLGGAPWQLLRNDRDQFVDISVPQGNIPQGFSPSSCTFGDVDGDGLVDLFIGVVPMFPLDLINAVLDTPFALSPPDKLYINKVGCNVLAECKETHLQRKLQRQQGWTMGQRCCSILL